MQFARLSSDTACQCKTKARNSSQIAARNHKSARTQLYIEGKDAQCDATIIELRIRAERNGLWKRIQASTIKHRGTRYRECSCYIIERRKI